MSIVASTEALRITRRLVVDFDTSPNATGSGFYISPNKLLTCAHVVRSDKGELANKIRVIDTSGTSREASILDVQRTYDLALLECKEDIVKPEIQTDLPEIGLAVVFAGMPAGLLKISVFPGMVSQVGGALIPRPKCEMIQIAGMVNNGNSGGPLFNASNGEILGIVTAKYVPLLQEINKLNETLSQIPQFPSSVGIGEIDFARFVNLTLGSIQQVSAVLRLVQVGTGWAVPSNMFTNLKGV